MTVFGQPEGSSETATLARLCFNSALYLFIVVNYEAGSPRKEYLFELLSRKSFACLQPFVLYKCRALFKRDLAVCRNMQQKSLG